MCFKPTTADEDDDGFTSPNFEMLSIQESGEDEIQVERPQRRRAQREPVIERVINFGRNLFRRIRRRRWRINRPNSAADLMNSPNPIESSSRPETPSPPREIENYMFPNLDPEPVSIEKPLPWKKNINVKKPLVDADNPVDNYGVSITLEEIPPPIDREGRGMKIRKSYGIDRYLENLYPGYTDYSSSGNTRSASNVQSVKPSDKKISDTIKEEIIKSDENKAEASIGETNKAEASVSETNKAGASVSGTNDAKASVSETNEAKASVSGTNDAKASVSKRNDAEPEVKEPETSS